MSIHAAAPIIHALNIAGCEKSVKIPLKSTVVYPTVWASWHWHCQPLPQWRGSALPALMFLAKCAKNL
jgi:hypothetical protein